MGLFEIIIEDFVVHKKNPLNQGFLALLVYRLRYNVKNMRPDFLKFFLSKILDVVAYFSEYICGITILPSTVVGRRLRIWHHGCIIINCKSIGDDVVIRQGTTIGEAGRDKPGLPVIGDCVDIGCNSVIIGPVTVEKNSVIGACSLVIKNVPENSVVGGVPAKVIGNVRGTA